MTKCFPSPKAMGVPKSLGLRKKGIVIKKLLVEWVTGFGGVQKAHFSLKDDRSCLTVLKCDDGTYTYYIDNEQPIQDLTLDQVFAVVETIAPG